jgi:hypothetical protein
MAGVQRALQGSLLLLSIYSVKAHVRRSCQIEPWSTACKTTAVAGGERPIAWIWRIC